MNQQPQQDASLAYVAVGFAVMALGIRSFVGAAVVASHRKRIASGSWSLNVQSNLPAGATNGDRLLFVFQQKTIIESALVEGAAFFVLVTFLLVGQWWSLAIVGALITVILVPFPTYDRVEEWVRYQLELMELERP
jgi:polyferredoxin